MQPSTAVKKKPSSMKSANSRLSTIAFAAALSWLISTWPLTSCARSGSPKQPPTLYQPGMLILPAGQPVQTKDGIYVPEREEQWFSPEVIRLLEIQEPAPR